MYTRVSWLWYSKSASRRLFGVQSNIIDFILFSPPEQFFTLPQGHFCEFGVSNLCSMSYERHMLLSAKLLEELKPNKWTNFLFLYLWTYETFRLSTFWVPKYPTINNLRVPVTTEELYNKMRPWRSCGDLDFTRPWKKGCLSNADNYPRNCLQPRAVGSKADKIGGS